MMPYEIVKTVKRHNIDARSNFLIGFRDEEQLILSTKEFAKIYLKKVLIKFIKKICTLPRDPWILTSH